MESSSVDTRASLAEKCQGIQHWISFPSKCSKIHFRKQRAVENPEYLDEDDLCDDIDQMISQGRHKSGHSHTPNYSLSSKLMQFEAPREKPKLVTAVEYDNELKDIVWRNIPPPVRFVSYTPLAQLRRMQFIVLSNGDAEALLNNEDKVVIWKSTTHIPQTKTPMHYSWTTLDSRDKSKNIWLQMCVNDLIPKVQWDWVEKGFLEPFRILDEECFPLLSTVLNTKLFRSPVKLSILHTKELVVDSQARYPLDSVRIDDQTVRIEGKLATSFKMNSEEEAEIWKTQIDLLLRNRSSCFVDLCMRCIGAYANTVTHTNQIIAAVCSPYMLFTISLLNEGITDYIFNILAGRNMLNFFVRCLVMSAVNVSITFDELYSMDDDEYSKALVSLFLSVSRTWAENLLQILEENDVSSGLDLLNVLYSMFSLLNCNGFYIIRLVTILTFVKYPKHQCPSIALFRFIGRCLMAVRESKAKLAFDNLEELLLDEPYDHMLLLMVYPFVQKIVDTVPEVEFDADAIVAQANKLYAKINENVEIVTRCLNNLIERDQADHPLAHCYAECVSLNGRNAWR